MIRIGIVGAENSHTVTIAKTLNIDKKVPGFRVVSVWGEAPRFAKDAAERGQIPEIVRAPEDMIGSVDAVVVDHRSPVVHLAAARPLLEARIPLFIDKPFCYRVKEGKEFLARARRLRVPVSSHSVQPLQASFVALRKEAKTLGRIISVVATGPCDVHSKYGGVFFYGIHQVAMVAQLLDHDVTHGQINIGKKNNTATLYSAGGAVSTLNLIGETRPAFHITIIGEKGRIDRQIVRDKTPHLTGIRAFCRMFRSGKTHETEQSMLVPIAVLQALERSLKTRKRVRVPAV